MSEILTGEHPELGILYACVDPTARFTEPKVAGSRLAARLAPFTDRGAAVDALSRSGVVRGGEA